MCDHEVIRQLHRLLLRLQRSRLLVSSILGACLPQLCGIGASLLAIMHMSRPLLRIWMTCGSSRCMAACCMACIRLNACLRSLPSNRPLLLPLLLVYMGQ